MTLVDWIFIGVGVWVFLAFALGPWIGRIFKGPPTPPRK